MLTLKNSKELLEHFNYPIFNHATSIKCLDYSHTWNNNTSQENEKRTHGYYPKNSVIVESGNRRYKTLILGHEEA